MKTEFITWIYYQVAYMYTYLSALHKNKEPSQFSSGHHFF